MAMKTAVDPPKKIIALEKKVSALEEERDRLLEEQEALGGMIKANLALNYSLPLKELLTLILESARSVMRCETASILLLNERSRRLEFELSLDEAGRKLLKMHLEISEGIAGKVAGSGEPYIANDVQKDPCFSRRFDRMSGFETRSILAVPLLSREKLIGVMELINKEEGTFSALDLRKAMALACLAAVAVENARLYRQAEEVGNLRETSRLRTELMAQVAHELKNPVFHIRMFTDWVRERKDLNRAKLEKYLEEISGEVSRLDRLIDSFLTISLLESGKVSLRLENFSLRELLHQRIRSFQQSSALHSFKTDFPKKDVKVQLDRDKTTQVVDNLLGNALKFSPLGGSIEVTLKEQKDKVLVSVRDEGIGIPPEDQNGIFRLFFRGSSPEALGVKGTGLGLAVTKLLVEHQGGSISFSSTPGRGTSFSFILPKIIKE